MKEIVEVVKVFAPTITVECSVCGVKYTGRLTLGLEIDEGYLELPLSTSGAFLGDIEIVEGMTLPIVCGDCITRGYSPMMFWSKEEKREYRESVQEGEDGD